MFVIFIENKESWNTSTTMAAVGVRVSKEKDKSGVRKKKTTNQHRTERLTRTTKC